MPCTQTGSLEGDRALAAEETNEALAEKITELTQLLCEACQIISDLKSWNRASDQLVDWSIAHDEIDEGVTKRDEEQRRKRLDALREARDQVDAEIEALEEEG